MMTPVRLAAVAAALAVALPQMAAAVPLPATVLLVTDVGADAPYMARPLWRKLATQYVDARAVAGEDGAAPASEERCRAARAVYAVFARFERAPQSAGATRDPARGYGVARFVVRNCVSGAVREKTLELVSDPLSEPYRGEFADNAEQIWDRPVRVATERDPLRLGPIGRVVRLDGDIVVIEAGGAFSANQLLRVFADAAAKPYATPLELVAVDVAGRIVQATISGKGVPRPGDYVEPVK